MFCRLTLPLLLTATVFAGETTPAAPQSFRTGKFGEVVNDVAVLSGPGDKKRDARKDAPFIDTELVKTARKSRTQITMEDGTVIRIGANSVFSFGKGTRTLNLEQGSVLLHTPAGKGGGMVVTNSATASVTGTTIAVSLDPKGRYECAVLEGDARIGTPGHAPVTLRAGGIVSIAGPGTPPVAGTFDINAFVKNSPLTAGFAEALPSLPAINAAIAGQSGLSGIHPTMTPAATSDIPDGDTGTPAPGLPSANMPTFRADVSAGLQPLSPNGEGSSTL